MEAKKALLEAYHNLRGMYDEHDDNTQVLYFTYGTAAFSSFAGAPKTVAF